MKQQNEEIKLLENEILNIGMRFTAISNENNRFKQVNINALPFIKCLLRQSKSKGIEEYTDEIEKYTRRMEDNRNNEVVLHDEYSKLKSSFKFNIYFLKAGFFNFYASLDQVEDGWEADRLLKILFEENDLILINKFSKIFGITEAREVKLSNVTENIYKQLHNLAESIDTSDSKKHGILYF